MKYLTLLLPLILIFAVAHAEWERILDELTYSIASDGERLYAGTARGILYSRDDGDTWRLSDFKQPAVNLTASPDAIYASTWGLGIIRSVTKGNTWHLKNNGFDPQSDYPRVRQFLVTSFGMVIAVSNAGTWISRDRGDRWHSIIDEWEVKDQYGDGFRFGDRIWSMGEFGGYLWALYQGQRALRSPDEGATWETIPDWVHGRTIGQFGWAEVWITFRGEFYVAEGRGFRHVGAKRGSNGRISVTASRRCPAYVPASCIVTASTPVRGGMTACCGVTACSCLIIMPRLGIRRGCPTGLFAPAGSCPTAGVSTPTLRPTDIRAYTAPSVPSCLSKAKPPPLGAPVKRGKLP